MKHLSISSLCSYAFKFLFIFSIAACSNKQPADLIIHNAKIYTVDSSFSIANAFAIKDGKFIAIGTDDDILNKFSSTEIIDAEQKAVYPGFIDSHCHFYAYGKGLQEVDLVGTKSFAEVIEKLKKIKPGIDWIIGRGWDQNDWDVKEYPNKAILDSLFPCTPVLLERIDGHAALVNSKAFELANINPSTKINGGIIEQTHDKNPIQTPYSALTGILIDNAVDLVKNVIPKTNASQIRTSLLDAQKNCFAVGLTTVDDAGLDKDIVDEIDALQKDNELKMRVYAMLSDNKVNINYYLKNGRYKTDRLNVRSFKFYADGALGSRGACLLQPYSDQKDKQGFLLSSKEHFDSAATMMSDNNFQMNTHAIGDSAVRFIAQEYISYCRKQTRVMTKSNPNMFHAKDIRWRVEHCQVLDKNDFSYFKYIIPSVQPTHATSDMYWAKDRLGEERVKYAYAYNDLLKAFGKIALGTDFPVEDINPLYTFYAAVARQDLKGFPEGGFQMENALSRENTLRGMTIWGAFANFEEHEKGSIEVGKFADFVILDNDIMNCEIHEVPKTKVVYTFVNGEKVYAK